MDAKYKHTRQKQQHYIFTSTFSMTGTDKNISTVTSARLNPVKWKTEEYLFQSSAEIQKRRNSHTGELKCFLFLMSFSLNVKHFSKLQRH